MDQWFCGTTIRSDNYLWYEAEALAERFDPWVHHRYAPVLYALVVILLLTTRVAFELIELVFKIEMLLGLVLWFSVTALLT